MNWFVISENEHLGPFEEEILEQLFQAGDLNETSLVWREGMIEPVAYKNVFFESETEESETEENVPEQSLSDEPEIEVDDELPPALPPEVLAARTQSPSSEEDEDFEIEELGKVDNELGTNEDEPVEEYELEEEQSEPEDYSQPKSKISIVKLIAGFLILAAVAGAGWFYYTSNFMVFSRPSRMGVADYERLKGVATSQGQNQQFALSIAKDKSTIWMATNNPYAGPVILNITSVPGKTLSAEPIMATARGSLEGKIATFSTFEFERGQRLIEGWYEVELVTPVDLEVPLSAKFSRGFPKRIRYIDQVLLTAMKPGHFQKALKRFNEKKNQNAKAFWEELEEKYRTVKAITSNIHSGISKVFEEGGAPWSEKVNAFENEYKSNYGNFFTNFVIQNENAYGEIDSKRFPDKNDVISSYARLTRLAKSVGHETMGALRELRSLETPENAESKQILQAKIEASFSRMTSEMDERLGEIGEKLN